MGRAALQSSKSSGLLMMFLSWKLLILLPLTTLLPSPTESRSLALPCPGSKRTSSASCPTASDPKLKRPGIPHPEDEAWKMHRDETLNHLARRKVLHLTSSYC